MTDLDSGGRARRSVGLVAQAVGTEDTKTLRQRDEGMENRPEDLDCSRDEENSSGRREGEGQIMQGQGQQCTMGGG